MSLKNAHHQSSPTRITEVAILPLSHPDPASLPYQTLTRLATAKRVLEASSGHTFTYYRSLTEPPALYLFGTWDSLEAHNAFLSSPENLELLELLKDDIKIDGVQMWHLDADFFKVEEGRKSLLEAWTLGFVRYTVPNVEDFLKYYEKFKIALMEGARIGKDAATYEIAGGLKIEQSDEEEWDMFCGFDEEKNYWLNNLHHINADVVTVSVIVCLKRLELL